MNIFVTLPLLIVALLSPTLTLTKLLQQKEWRVDRLVEHLRKEQWLRQLFGVFRPLLTALWLLVSAFLLILLPDSLEYRTHVTALFLLLQSALSCIQIGSQKQPIPVWTSKAIIISSLSFLLPLLIASAILTKQTSLTPLIIGLIASLPPLWTISSWTLFMPIDKTIKNIIFSRAEKIRKSHPNLIIIGITGSVGKTTMKDALFHLLKGKGAIVTPKRINTDMGVAKWLTSVLKNEPCNSSRIVIVEMGAYRVGEIALLCKIAQPTIGIITAVGLQHLSLFGSQEQIIQGKGELFAALPKNGLAIGNSDNESFEALKNRAKCPVISVGTDHHAEIQALDIEETGDGLRFRIFETLFHSSLAGTHSVIGLAMAIVVAKHIGIEPKIVAKMLPSFHRLQSTFEVKNINGVSVLDDSYNSSPESVAAAIDWAARRPEKEKYLLLEGIIELGDAEEEIHKALAEKAEKVFKTVFLAHTRLLSYFEANAKEASKATLLNKGALLVVCGRVRPALLEKFLSVS